MTTGRHECDFIVTRNRRPTLAIKVCWELDTQNERRELAGLAEAARTLEIPELLVLTFDQRKTVEVAGTEVRVMPAWEWMVVKDDCYSMKV